jgi:hypothetical protein
MVAGAVSERLLEYLKVGAPVSAQVDASDATYSGSIARSRPPLGSTRDRRGKGSGGAFDATGTFRRDGGLDNADGNLLPRAAVRVKIEPPAGLRLPRVERILAVVPKRSLVKKKPRGCGAFTRSRVAWI